MLCCSTNSESCYHFNLGVFFKTLILLLGLFPLFLQIAFAQEEPADHVKVASPSIISREQTKDLSSLIERSLNTFSRKQVTNNQFLQLTPEQQEWLNNHKTIRLGVDANWAPYEFVDEAGKLQGVSSDILNLIEQKLGIHFKIIWQYSWTEILEKAKNHEIDMLSSIRQSSNREKYLLFTEPFLNPLAAIYTRANNTNIFNIQDLKNKTVAIEKQYYFHEKLLADFPEINLLPVETTLDALKLVSYGKADAYIGDQGPANWIAEKNAINNLQPRPESTLSKIPLRLAVRKDWSIFQNILNRALADITSAELSAIRRKWLGSDSKSKKLNLTFAEQEWIKKHPVIRLGAESNWPPYEFVANSGELEGFSIDVARLVEQKIGIKFKSVSEYSWAEILDKVKLSACFKSNKDVLQVEY